MQLVDTLEPGQVDPFANYRGTITPRILRMAMRDGYCVSFNYDGKFRLVEVHAIGTSTKDGSLVMRGMQVGGAASRPLPQWTLFTLSKIDGLAIDVERSEAPREGYAQGDRQMRVVLSEIKL